MKNINKYASSVLSSILFASLMAAVSQSATGQEIGAWETSSNNAGAGIAWNANPTIWQTNTSSGWVIPGGNTDGISYPDTNSTTVTLLPGAFVTNTVLTTVNQLTISNQAVLGQGSSISVLHNTATTYDWDIFGGVQQSYGSGLSLNLNNSAVIAVENGGGMTNLTGTSADYFENYNATNILFLNGSTYVMGGTKSASSSCTFPQATWSSNSTTIFAPAIAGNTVSPKGMVGQTFGTFIWDWPLQNGKCGGSTIAGNYTFGGSFIIADGGTQVIEDIPGTTSGVTNAMTVAGSILITNAAWFPTASSGFLSITLGGNLIVNPTGEIKMNSGTAIGNVTFNGTAPQILAIYGTNGSQGNFNWTVNSSSTVDLGAGLTNGASQVAGQSSFTDNGWVDLGGNSLVNTNLFGSGIISNSVGTAFLGSQAGSFGGNIAGGKGVINLNANGPLTFTLTGVNTYTGNTTITGGGTLALTGSASIAGTTNISINAGSIFDVSGLSSAFTLGAGQTLKNNGSTAQISGSATTGSGTVSLTYTSGVPALVISNGNLSVSSGTVVRINNTSAALAAGTYTIITNTTAGLPGSVTGTAPSSVSVNGNGLAAGLSASLQVSGGDLNLVVASGSTQKPNFTGIHVSGTTLTISGTNGTAGAQFTIFETTNIATPLPWTPILTNTYNSGGGFSFSTNILSANNHQMYFISK